MNKNHYKYFYLDFNIYKKYLDTGIIPEGLRKDRFIKKFEDVKIEHQNVLSWNNRTCLYQEDIPVFINKIYKDPVLGNKGYGALYFTISKDYFGISRDRVKDELNKLESYQLHKPIIHQKVKRNILVKQPLNQFQIDLTSITDTYNGYKYIAIIIDLFTKFIYTKALKNKDVKTVLDFVKKVFLIEKPKILQSDNGGEFKNDLMNKYLLSINVKQVYSKSYTPTTQGAVERCNRTIKGMIFRYLTSNNTNNWVFILPQITENYNNSKHSSIGMSPLDLKNSSKSLIRAVHKDNILTSKKNIIKHHRSFTPLALYDLCCLDVKSNNKDTTFT